MDYINIGLRSYTIILLISTLSLIAGSNTNCNGQAFHCVNSTHFKICVDLGHGVSTTVDEFLIPCPQNTVCKQYNLFECEYELTTTLPPVTIQSEVTNEQFKTIDSSVREQLDITTLFPTKQQEGMELSEKYYNKINATPASFTKSLLTDAVIDSVNTSNANELHTSSKGDINKTLNISQSTVKELIFSISANDATQTSPYNINTLVTDAGIGSNYNTETPVLLSTTQDRRTIDSFKNESFEPLNQSSSDLDASYAVTKSTNKIASVSELRYSAVTLLPGNFSDLSLQENTPGTLNLNHLIKPDNTSQDNLDILMKYNSTQSNNSDNNTQYRNINNSMYSKNTSTDINTLNSTPFNVITDEIFTSVSDINKESKLNVITLKSSRQHLAEITTASTIIVPGTTNQFSSHISLNTEVIETLFNDGLNITTNLEKISVSDGDIMTSTSSIPETSVAKINDMLSQITKSGFNDGISSVALTEPVLDEKNATLSNQSQMSDTKSSKLRSNSEIFNLKNIFEVNFTTELNSVNNSQYLTTTEPYFHDKSDIPISSTSKSEVPSPINISEVLPFRSKEATQVNNASQMNNAKIMENELVSTKTPEIQSYSSFSPRSNFSLFTTAATKTATNDKTIVGDYSFTNVDMLPVLTTSEMSNGPTSLKPLQDLISENKPWPESVIVTGATGFLNNNTTTTEESNYITGEISKGVTSLKSISDLFLKNESAPKLPMVTIATDLDNNNITITEESINITAELSNGVTNENETWPKPVMVAVATDLYNNNTVITEESNNITGKISKGVTRLKPISDLPLKDETWPNPVMVTVDTSIDNNNTTITEESNNKTSEISNGVMSLKSILDLNSKNETSPKSVIGTVATNLDNNNTTITKESKNITAELSNREPSLKSISDLNLKNETSPKPVIVLVATDLDNSNTTITEESNIITAEITNRVPSLKSISDLNSKNETSQKPVIVLVATDLDNNNTTITKESKNITAELSNRVPSLKSISDLNSKNETSQKSVIVLVATDLDNNNTTITKESKNITAELSNRVPSLKSISDLNLKNETSPKPVIVLVATDLDNSNTTITEESNIITAEITNRVPSLKSISDLNSKNETSQKPVIVLVATDLDNNNTTITKESKNITAELSNRVPSLKSISDLNSKNETSQKSVIVLVATDLDNNNTTITKESKNITAELSNRVPSLKSISDLNSKNETSPKSVIVSVATNLNNSNTTITEESNNITAEITKRVPSLKSISDLNSKNETSPKPVIVSVATDLDISNTTITEESNNITGEITNRVLSLKSISDLNSKNETSQKPVIVLVATDLDNNNTTITEVSNNITAELSKGVTSLKSISDLNSKNKTSPKPAMVTASTDLDNNNTTITEKSNNITGEIFKGVISWKPILLKNETWPKPVMVTVDTGIDNNNTTITEESNNKKSEISNGVMSLKSILDLNSKNETSPKLVIVTVATDLDNNNVTTKGDNNNKTAGISNGIKNLKSISDLITKNETSPKSVTVTFATNLDNNNTTITKESNNITAELSKGVTSLKSKSDLFSKNETSPRPVIVSVATDLDNSNTTITEVSNNITAELSKGVTSLKPISNLISNNETRPIPVIMTVATDLDTNNTTITEESNYKTVELSNGVTSLKSISDLIPTTPKTQPTVLKLYDDTIHQNIFVTSSSIFTDHQSLNETTTSLSSLTKIPDNNLKTTDFNKNSVRLISSTDSVISDLERNTTRIITKLPTTLDKPTTLADRSSGVLDNQNTNHNNDTTKPIINSLYEINKALSSNYTYNDNDNRTTDVYQTTTESDRALNTVESVTGPAVFKSSNSMNVTNNTFIAIDVLSEHRVISDNNKNIENTSKLESEIKRKPSTYFDSNKSVNNISSDTKNVTTLSFESAKNDMNTKQVIYQNTSDNGKIIGKNTFGNPNSTKLNPENILIPKIVTSNSFSSSPAFHIIYINNNITDKNNNSLKDVEVKHYQVTNNLVEKLLTVGVNNTYLNYPDKNVVTSVSKNSKSIPLIYLHNSLRKPPLTNIYNVSHSENISQTLTVNKTTASNKNHETEDKESSQTNKNGLVPSHTVSIIKHERNKTEYLLLNPYTQVNTTVIKVNDTTLKEFYNFSEPSFTVRNNVNGFIMKNLTTSINKNTAPKGFYGTKGSGYDKSNSTTTIKSVNTNNCTNCSKLADYFQLSEITNSQLQNVIKPLLIKPLQEVKKTSSLHPENGNIFSGNILNNWGIVNTTLVANNTEPTKTFTREGNVSEVNNLTFIQSTEKYTNELIATSESNITANNLLRNTSSQTNTIRNKTHDGMPSDGLKFSRIPSEFDKSSQSTGPLKLETTPFVSNRTKLEIISEQEKFNGIEKKQLTNSHGHSESNLTIANVTKNIRNNTQNSFTIRINNINYPNTHYGNLPTNQEFRCTKRGKFSNAKDCNKFFVCIGRVQPIIGQCPKNTVFSESLKQCTKNVTHCIRNNQFKCTSVGRFVNILCNNTYFICAKKNSSFIRLTFQCQKGYCLDKNNVKCTPESKNISKSDENNSKNTKELSFDKSKEMEGVSINSKNVFECEKEGKFNDPQNCRKYYICKKGRKSIYRRKIKQCDSDEVFHRKKKKCVDVDSYECNI